jgi:hypothetical protein
MTMRKMGWGLLLASPLLASFGCAATKLNDVGDVNGASGADTGGTSNDEPGAGGMVADPPGGTGGTGGTSINPDPVVAGAAGDTTQAPLTCDDCVVIASNRDVRDIAVTDDKVYWVEYGTVEQGIHTENGRVMARDLDGGPEEVLADDQFGPFGIGVSAQHAYVARHSGSNEAELLRLPLVGGAEELLMPVDLNSWPLDHWFVAAPTQVFLLPGAAYRVLSTPASEPEEVLDYALEITSDDSTLYLLNDDTSVTTLPYGTGLPGSLPALGEISTSGSIGKIAIVGAYIYGVEIDNSERSEPAVHYLGRSPKAGGSWTRVARLSVGPSSGLVELKFHGDSFFFNSSTDDDRLGISQGSLQDPEEQALLVSAPIGEGPLGVRWQAWNVGRTGVFFADGSKLYLKPIAQ